MKGEVKTPRMVKQASKKNSKVKRSGSGEEDSESLEVRLSIDECLSLCFRGSCTVIMIVILIGEHNSAQE